MSVAQDYSQYGGYQPAAPAPAYGQAPAPAYGAPAYGQQAPAALPLNQLYSTDLLSELPAPIGDLQFAPPPLVLPAGASVTGGDTSNAPCEYLRSTLNVIPKNNSTLKKTKLPLALIVRPYVSLRDDDRPVAVVSDTIISRCRRCRSYINPFVAFVEQGKRWRCALCNLQNDVPSGFDYNSHMSQSVNRYDRNELNHSVVEFIAPPEYMVRAPQPLVYVFVIDVSISAVASGLTATVARTILESLDRIPNKDGRTRVAFIGVDSSLHFFHIPAEADGEPSLMVVPDLDEPFLPAPDNLLVTLQDNRLQVEKLLEKLPGIFADTQNANFALGPALRTAHKMIASIGGKVQVFAATLPNMGVGKLTLRDEESVSQKPKEASTLLSSNSPFYKTFAIECNKSQITVDMFLSSSKYQDVASLANLPRFTSGQTHFYPAWTAARVEDVTKFSRELSNHLSMDITLEAVLRVRGSGGIRMSAFYGNFFNRSSDLCSFPTFPRDQSYVIEMSLEENLVKPFVVVQAAVLHTTAFGERRIRVVTLAIPTSDDLRSIYASADQLAIANYYTQKAVEKVYSSSLNDARELLSNKVSDILSVYKKEVAPANMGGSSPLQISTNMRMLPLILHSLTKHIGLRNGKVPSDHRASALNKLASLPLPQLIQYIYPTVYSLHDMPDECGLAGEDGQMILPAASNASSEVLEKYGLYLISNGQEMFLFVGGDAVDGLVADVFGVATIHEVTVGKTELPVLDNDFNIRVRAIIDTIRDSNSTIVYQNLYIVRGPSPNEPLNNSNRDLMALRMWCFSELVEDKNNGGLSYREFLGALKQKLAS
ncbi:hypothetical protein BABINDRAFT_39925 [Babjeviella inositovora NRRL Y-12698]|uniref:Protein transport protein SEC24 n=1 Tax=Babjeviella inositovora NRRL Y-12698 TaxID=984486 RepID=A0A1E3QKI5_9ASCO|nr:uncharacterized protein BABINDRAFT_39925 [Babjeviella inositovora NRRL Y-12698]ODQ78195.1 hypothetical protein BABINDRAFT_39925 [Babjeviella inositovora NRRL Y-12698]